MIPRQSGRHPCSLVGATIAVLMLSAGLAGTFSEHRDTQAELRARLDAITQELEQATQELKRRDLELARLESELCERKQAGVISSQE